MDISQQADQAAAFIRKNWDAQPKFAIILGTGSGKLAERIETDCLVDYEQIPHFPKSTATGHAGQLVCGKLSGQPILAMKGRFHLYEGYDVDAATLPIHVFHRLGVQFLFVSNAGGGLNPKMGSGQIMLIQSHLDFMYRSTVNMVSSVEASRPTIRSDRYDLEMIDLAKQIARQHDFPIHEGVYAALLGPNYETRAEYRMLRRTGADVAGMSTVPEVTVATKYQMRVLGMSVITNIANPDSLESTSGEEVIAAAQTAAPQFATVVMETIKALS